MFILLMHDMSLNLMFITVAVYSKSPAFASFTLITKNCLFLAVMSPEIGNLVKYEESLFRPLFFVVLVPL